MNTKIVITEMKQTKQNELINNRSSIKCISAGGETTSFSILKTHQLVSYYIIKLFETLKMTSQITRDSNNNKALGQNRNMSALFQLQRDVKGLFMKYQRTQDVTKRQRRILNNKFYQKILFNDREGQRKTVKMNLLHQQNRDFNDELSEVPSHEDRMKLIKQQDTQNIDKHAVDKKMKIFEPSTKRLIYYNEEQLFNDDDELVQPGYINTLIGDLDMPKAMKKDMTGKVTSNMETVDFVQQKLFKQFFDKYKENEKNRDNDLMLTQNNSDHNDYESHLLDFYGSSNFKPTNEPRSKSFNQFRQAFRNKTVQQVLTLMKPQGKGNQVKFAGQDDDDDETSQKKQEDGKSQNDQSGKQSPKKWKDGPGVKNAEHPAWRRQTVFEQIQQIAPQEDSIDDSLTLTRQSRSYEPHCRVKNLYDKSNIKIDPETGKIDLRYLGSPQFIAQFMMNPHYVQHLSSYEYGALMSNAQIREEIQCLINQYNRKQFEQIIQKMIKKKRQEKLPGTKFDVAEYHKQFDETIQKQLKFILMYSNRDQFCKFIQGLYTLDQVLSRLTTGQPGQVYEVLDDFRDKINPAILKNSPMLDQLCKRLQEQPGLRNNNELFTIQEKCFNSIFWVPKDTKRDQARELQFNRQQQSIHVAKMAERRTAQEQKRQKNIVENILRHESRLDQLEQKKKLQTEQFHELKNEGMSTSQVRQKQLMENQQHIIATKVKPLEYSRELNNLLHRSSKDEPIAEIVAEVLAEKLGYKLDGTNKFVPKSSKQKKRKDEDSDDSEKSKKDSEKKLPQSLIKKMKAKNRYIERFHKIMFVNHLKNLGHKVVLSRPDRKLIQKYTQMMEGANIDDLAIDDDGAATSTPMNTTGSPIMFKSLSSKMHGESFSKQQRKEQTLLLRKHNQDSQKQAKLGESKSQPVDLCLTGTQFKSKAHFEPLVPQLKVSRASQPTQDDFAQMKSEKFKGKQPLKAQEILDNMRQQRRLEEQMWFEQYQNDMREYIEHIQAHNPQFFENCFAKEQKVVKSLVDGESPTLQISANRSTDHEKLLFQERGSHDIKNKPLDQVKNQALQRSFSYVNTDQYVKIQKNHSHIPESIELNQQKTELSVSIPHQKKKLQRVQTQNLDKQMNQIADKNATSQEKSDNQLKDEIIRKSLEKDMSLITYGDNQMGPVRQSHEMPTEQQLDNSSSKRNISLNYKIETEKKDQSQISHQYTHSFTNPPQEYSASKQQETNIVESQTLTHRNNARTQKNEQGPAEKQASASKPNQHDNWQEQNRITPYQPPQSAGLTPLKNQMYSHYEAHSASRSTLGENANPQNIEAGAFETSQSIYDLNARKDKQQQDQNQPFNNLAKIQIIPFNRDQQVLINQAIEQMQMERSSQTIDRLKSLEEIPISIKQNPYLLPYPFVQYQSAQQQQERNVYEDYGAIDEKRTQIIDFNKQIDRKLFQTPSIKSETFKLDVRKDQSLPKVSSQNIGARQSSHEPKLENSRIAQRKNAGSLVDVLDKIVRGTQDWKNSQEILECCYLISDSLLKNIQDDQDQDNLMSLNMKLGGIVNTKVRRASVDSISYQSKQSKMSKMEAQPEKSSQIQMINKKRVERVQQRAQRFTKLQKEKWPKLASSKLNLQNKKGPNVELKANSDLAKNRYQNLKNVPKVDLNIIKDILSQDNEQFQPTTEHQSRVTDGNTDAENNTKINLIIPHNNPSTKKGTLNAYLESNQKTVSNTLINTILSEGQSTAKNQQDDPETLQKKKELLEKLLETNMKKKDSLSQQISNKQEANDDQAQTPEVDMTTTDGRKLSNGAFQNELLQQPFDDTGMTVPLREQTIVDPQISSQLELKLQLSRVEKTVNDLQQTLLEYEAQVKKRAQGPAAQSTDQIDPQRNGSENQENATTKHQINQNNQIRKIIETGNNLKGRNAEIAMEATRQLIQDISKSSEERLTTNENEQTFTQPQLAPYYMNDPGIETTLKQESRDINDSIRDMMQNFKQFQGHVEVRQSNQRQKMNNQDYDQFSFNKIRPRSEHQKNQQSELQSNQYENLIEDEKHGDIYENRNFGIKIDPPQIKYSNQFNSTQNEQQQNQSSRHYQMSHDLLSSKFIKREVVLSNDNSNVNRQKTSLTNTYQREKQSKNHSQRHTPKVSDHRSDSLTGLISTKSKPQKNQTTLLKKLLVPNKDIENVAGTNEQESINRFSIKSQKSQPEAQTQNQSLLNQTEALNDRPKFNAAEVQLIEQKQSAHNSTRINQGFSEGLVVNGSAIPIPTAIIGKLNVNANSSNFKLSRSPSVAKEPFLREDATPDARAGQQSEELSPETFLGLQILTNDRGSLKNVESQDQQVQTTPSPLYGSDDMARPRNMKIQKIFQQKTAGQQCRVNYLTGQIHSTPQDPFGNIQQSLDTSVESIEIKDELNQKKLKDQKANKQQSNIPKLISQQTLKTNTLNLNEQVERINQIIEQKFSERKQMSKDLKIYDAEERFDNYHKNVNQLYQVPQRLTQNKELKQKRQDEELRKAFKETHIDVEKIIGFGMPAPEGENKQENGAESKETKQQSQDQNIKIQKPRIAGKQKNPQTITIKQTLLTRPRTQAGHAQVRVQKQARASAERLRQEEDQLMRQSTLYKQSLEGNFYNSAHNIRPQTQNSLRMSQTSMGGGIIGKAINNQRKAAESQYSINNTFEMGSKSTKDFSIRPKSPYIRKNIIREKLRYKKSINATQDAINLPKKSKYRDISGAFSTQIMGKLRDSTSSISTYQIHEAYGSIKPSSNFQIQMNKMAKDQGSKSNLNNILYSNQSILDHNNYQQNKQNVVFGRAKEKSELLDQPGNEPVQIQIQEQQRSYSVQSNLNLSNTQRAQSHGMDFNQQNKISYLAHDRMQKIVTRYQETFGAHKLYQNISRIQNRLNSVDNDQLKSPVVIVNQTGSGQLRKQGRPFAGIQ